MDKPLSPIENLLPGALSKWIFGTSILLSIALYKLFPDLPSNWLSQTESERFLLRLLITVTCLLLGSMSLIASLIHIIRKIKPELLNAKSDIVKLQNSITTVISDRQTITRELLRLKQEVADLKSQLSDASLKHSEETIQLNEKHKKEISDIRDSYKKTRPEIPNGPNGWMAR